MLERIKINFKQLEIMKKLVSVTCPEKLSEIVIATGSVKPCKVYPVLREDENMFEIVSDLTNTPISCLKTKCPHLNGLNWILNYESDTTERSREIVSKLLLDGFHATEGKVWADPNEYIYAAKDFGLEELANEMENCLK